MTNFFDKLLARSFGIGSDNTYLRPRKPSRYEKQSDDLSHATDILDMDDEQTTTLSESADQSYPVLPDRVSPDHNLNSQPPVLSPSVPPSDKHNQPHDARRSEPDLQQKTARQPLQQREIHHHIIETQKLDDDVKRERPQERSEASSAIIHPIKPAAAEAQNQRKTPEASPDDRSQAQPIPPIQPVFKKNATSDSDHDGSQIPATTPSRTVTVNIGRIDVQVPSSQNPTSPVPTNPSRQRTRFKPTMSLDEYMSKRR